jgi:hypothetical protein
MMEFLRALAPKRDGDPSRAVAVVPSRFAIERPMTALPMAAPHVESDVPPPAMDSSPRSVEHRAEQPHEAPMPGASLVVARPVGDAQRQREPAGESSPRVASREPRRDDAGPLRPLRISPAVSPPSGGIGRFDLQGREPREQAPATVPRAPAIAAATISPQAREPMRAVPAPLAAAAQPPMSRAFLAARVNPRADRSPVIEVTIDRLEVRAAAPVERMTPAIKRRAASPSVPLADYLRGKTGPPGGAA